tara:strand:+ start:2040 stop:2741 length:702 start_codon:yes stop_codon:yes gene_type:complete
MTRLDLVLQVGAKSRRAPSATGAPATPRVLPWAFPRPRVILELQLQAGKVVLSYSASDESTVPTTISRVDGVRQYDYTEKIELGPPDEDSRMPQTQALKQIFEAMNNLEQQPATDLRRVRWDRLNTMKFVAEYSPFVAEHSEEDLQRIPPLEVAFGRARAPPARGSAYRGVTWDLDDVDAAEPVYPSLADAGAPQDATDVERIVAAIAASNEYDAFKGMTITPMRQVRNLDLL